jgi:hypothetical protein
MDAASSVPLENRLGDVSFLGTESDQRIIRTDDLWAW